MESDHRLRIDAALPALSGRSAVLDGKVVCLDRDGHPDFAAVRARLTGAKVGAAGVSCLELTVGGSCPAAPP